MTTYLLDAISIAPQKARPLVLVVPGGGYRMCSDREREPIATQFLAKGFHACILDYSVAPNRFPTALRELAAAVACVRDHAEEWHVDPGAVIVCGFSAGGHLACSLGTFWNRPFAWEAIGREPAQIRPDGLVLCYPVITSGEFRHKGSFEELLGKDAGPEEMALQSLEHQVTADMPPVFLWHTMEDETVPVENSLLLASALRRAGVSCEIHLYPHGRHGLALATEETAGTREHSVVPGCQSWISLVQFWIENGFGN